jgi:hypothetical protein
LDDFAIAVPRSRRALGSEATMESESRLLRLVTGRA